MANIFAIHSVGASLAKFLNDSYPTALKAQHPCTFQLFSSQDLATMEDPETTNTFSVFLHRVTINEHLRNATQFNQTLYQKAPLSLDLHFLMSVWAKSPLTEHLVLGWAMHQLHEHSTLDISVLSHEAGWQDGDQVQLTLADLSNDDIMRIWDSFKPSYRLSVAYVARIVRIDSDSLEAALPVVATRFSWGDRANPNVSEVTP